MTVFESSSMVFVTINDLFYRPDLLDFNEVMSHSSNHDKITEALKIAENNLNIPTPIGAQGL